MKRFKLYNVMALFFV